MFSNPPSPIATLLTTTGWIQHHPSRLWCTLDMRMPVLNPEFFSRPDPKAASPLMPAHDSCSSCWEGFFAPKQELLVAYTWDRLAFGDTILTCCTVRLILLVPLIQLGGGGESVVGSVVGRFLGR